MRRLFNSISAQTFYIRMHICKYKNKNMIFSKFFGIHLWDFQIRITEGGWVRQRCPVAFVTGQLILAYSWARSAVLAADKGRRGMLLFLLFLHFLSFPSFFPIPLISTISSVSFLSFFGKRNKITDKG